MFKVLQGSLLAAEAEHSRPEHSEGESWAGLSAERLLWKSSTIPRLSGLSVSLPSLSIEN